jgi:hypothetical protein
MLEKMSARSGVKKEAMAQEKAGSLPRNNRQRALGHLAAEAPNDRHDGAVAL